MAGQERSLFPVDPQTLETLRILIGNEETLSIAYIGPRLEEGRMDAILLADGLKGYGRFVKRVADLQLSGMGEGFSLDVQGEPRNGSLEVFVRFYHPLASTLQGIADSKLLQGLAILAALTGLSAKDIGKSLIEAFRKRKGRPFKDADDLLALPDDLPIPKTSSYDYSMMQSCKLIFVQHCVRYAKTELNALRQDRSRLPSTQSPSRICFLQTQQS